MFPNIIQGWETEILDVRCEILLRTLDIRRGLKIKVQLIDKHFVYISKFIRFCIKVNFGYFKIFPKTRGSVFKNPRHPLNLPVNLAVTIFFPTDINR